MAHLLMIESWVGASGNLLPPLLRELGHKMRENLLRKRIKNLS